MNKSKSFKNKIKCSDKGFTLVELVVVMVILAIVASITVPAMLGYFDKARQKKILTNAEATLHATQTLASSCYGTFSNPGLNKSRVTKEAVQDKSGLDASVDDFEITVAYQYKYDAGKVTPGMYEIAKYTYTEDGITATYLASTGEWTFEEVDYSESDAPLASEDPELNPDLEIRTTEEATTEEEETTEEPQTTEVITTEEPTTEEPTTEEPTTEEPTTEEPTTEEPATKKAFDEVDLTSHELDVGLNDVNGVDDGTPKFISSYVTEGWRCIKSRISTSSESNTYGDRMTASFEALLEENNIEYSAKNLYITLQSPSNMCINGSYLPSIIVYSGVDFDFTDGSTVEESIDAYLEKNGTDDLVLDKDEGWRYSKSIKLNPDYIQVYVCTMTNYSYDTYYWMKLDSDIEPTAYLNYCRITNSYWDSEGKHEYYTYEVTLDYVIVEANSSYTGRQCITINN